jgi:hypothetical protein
MIKNQYPSIAEKTIARMARDVITRQLKPDEARQFISSIIKTGLSLLSPEDKKILLEINKKLASALSPDDKERIQALRAKVAMGGVRTPEETVLVRDLATKEFNGLNSQDQAEFQRIYDLALSLALAQK